MLYLETRMAKSSKPKALIDEVYADVPNAIDELTEEVAAAIAAQRMLGETGGFTRQKELKGKFSIAVYGGVGIGWDGSVADVMLRVSMRFDAGTGLGPTAVRTNECTVPATAIQNAKGFIKNYTLLNIESWRDTLVA